MSSLIQLNNVTKVYATGAGEHSVLDNVQLEVGQGEFVSILGKSGSGKSTLLNILSAIDTPTSGMVNINGRNTCEGSLSALDSWRGQNIGLVFQFFQLMPTLTALENVMLPMEFCSSIPARARRTRAQVLLKQVMLAHKQDSFPSALSGGEQQRVAIARALANDAPIILADEPTGNLDTANASNIYQLFAELNQQGKTVVIVSHDLSVCDYAHRTIQLSDGHILSDTCVDVQTSSDRGLSHV